MVIPEIHTKVVARVKNCPLTYVILRPIQYGIVEYKEDVKYDDTKMKHYAQVLSNY